MQSRKLKKGKHISVCFDKMQHTDSPHLSKPPRYLILSETSVMLHSLRAASWER